MAVSSETRPGTARPTPAGVPSPEAARWPMKSRMALTTASGPSERGVWRRSLSSTAPDSLTRPPFMDVPPTSSATTNEVEDTERDNSAAQQMSGKVGRQARPSTLSSAASTSAESPESPAGVEDAGDAEDAPCPTPRGRPSEPPVRRRRSGIPPHRAGRSASWSRRWRTRRGRGRAAAGSPGRSAPAFRGGPRASTGCAADRVGLPGPAAVAGHRLASVRKCRRVPCGTRRCRAPGGSG